ncbi:Siderophore biosynthesis non-ribosomal peptide synthetase modules 1 [Pectobacterium sp. F1-1]|uniref:non-ribosomal peptide synthetase n=1 Tax=Pectobacterium sp. F1-1 TaxID=2949614 RepID=UPI0021D7CC59|nr:non-ribosomal peptide synthetase [Pectobacterium sp. F1-1]UYA58815.1 Siderophore biosynthesis non-ribosomal peptide synthetase modules 1 [Pectobacterium sp. F1-1]
MKDIVTLLKQLERQGVRLALNAQGQLISQSSKDAITPEIGRTIKENKDAIVRCLTAQQAFERPITPQNATSGPLSSSQSGLWFIEQYEEQSHLYNMPVYFRLTGTLDVAALEFAFDALAQRHASLRTRFVVNEHGKGEQRIDAYQPFVIQHDDFSSLPEDEREGRLQQQVKAEISRPFDLTAGDLTRVRLVKMSERVHVLMITQHHIISDGWSVKNMFADFKPAFLACQNRQPYPVEPTQLNYIDYAHWFNSASFLDYHNEFKPFWVERLTGIPEVHSLPLDKPRPAHQNSGGEVIFSAINNDLWDKFKRLCQRYNTSNFIGLHAVFSLLLARISGEKDIVIGSPLAYRERPDIEDVVGFFVNTIVLRTQLQDSQRFVDYLQYCREQDLSAFDHQLYRFEALSEAIGSDRTTAINPIFQVMLVYQAKVDFNDLIPGCDAEEETSPVLPAKTDISVKVTELMGEVRLDWLFATALFERQTIQYYADRFIRLIEAVVEAPETDVWHLPLMEADRFAAVLAESQQLPRSYPQPQLTVTDVIEAIAQRDPQQLAIAFDGEQRTDTLTYAELNRQSNQLAHWLHRQGLGEQSLVGVLAKRDRYFVIALLAVWKAGAAYVPLDPDYPPERLRHIITDANLAVILGGDGQQLAQWSAEQCIDLTDPAIVAQWHDLSGDEPPAIPRHAQQLAQVIYTSGSTGLPKGVMIEHGSLINLLDDHRDRIAFTSQSTMFNCMSLSFDAGNMTTLLPLSSGGTLAFGEPNDRAIVHAEQAGATHLILPTALMSILDPKQVNGIQAIGMGGEACPNAVVENWADKVALYNMYGPTECTVTALSTRLRKGQPVTIGQPIAHIQALILDAAGQLCPAGVPGELCLAGLGLARGYLNQPQMTASRFEHITLNDVNHTGQGTATLRIYRTGDKARLLNNGDYEYCGRIDEQIKLRGYRIEPGEIEAQLAAVCPSLKQVKVIVAQVGNRPALVAYGTVKADSSTPEPAAVLIDVAKHLPEYMVPFRLILLEVMPLTPNGKLDMKQLPPVLEASEGDGEADNPLEADVLAIWRSVLNTPLGVEDDFFRLGGDSILSIQLTTRLRSAGYACTVKDVFEAKSVRRLCRVLAQNNRDTGIVAEQGMLEGEFALLPIQRWFMKQPLARPEHWNQAAMIQLPDVDTERLTTMLQALMAQHDALRLACDADGQRYLTEVSFPAVSMLDYRQLGDDGLQQAFTALQREFDPAQGRTMACALVRHHPQADTALFLAFHHLVIDAVSWRILVDDLERLYLGEPLSPKTSSYRQWGTALHHYATQHAEQLAYWQAQEDGGDQTALLAAKDPQGHASAAMLTLDAETTGQLVSEANRAFNTEVSDLLLAALTRTLNELGWGDNARIMLEGHGREAIDPTLDVSRTVGWFTSTYPVCLQDKPDWASLIKSSKEQLRQVPDKGVGFNPLRDYHPQGSSLTLSPIVFNYLGLSVQAAGVWRPVDVAPGCCVSPENKPEEIISLHGGIAGGQLTLRQVGCLNQHDSDRLMVRLTENIRALTAACLAQLRHGTVFTPSDFPAVMLSQTPLDSLSQRYDIDTLLPLSSLQQSMLYHRLRCPQDDAYHLQTPVRYAQALDVEGYRQAWQRQIQRFPALRAALESEQASVQVIVKQAELPFYYQDVAQEADPQAVIERYRQQDLRTGFDLSQPPLLRIACFRVGEQDYRVLLSCHHSIIDGWSGPQLLGAVHRDYQLLMNGQALIHGEAPAIQVDRAYVDYALHAVAQQPAVDAFWQQRQPLLAQTNDVAMLFAATGKRADLSQHLTQVEPQVTGVSLNEQDQATLTAFAREVGVTHSIIAQYAWHRLLARSTGDAVSIVGNVLSGRESPVEGVASSVGLYINSLPLALSWQQPVSLQQHLVQLQNELMAMNQHATQSLIALTAGRPRLFNSLFVYENYPVNENRPGAKEEQGERADDPHRLSPEFSAAYEKVEMPLNLVVREQAGCMLLRFEFDADVLDSAQARRVLMRWHDEVVALVNSSPQQPTEIVGHNKVADAAMRQVAMQDSRAGSPDTPSAQSLLRVWAQTLKRSESGLWSQTLCESGVDSLQRIALAQALSRALAQPVSVALLQRYPSPQALSGYLAQSKVTANEGTLS